MLCAALSAMLLLAATPMVVAAGDVAADGNTLPAGEASPEACLALLHELCADAAAEGLGPCKKCLHAEDHRSRIVPVCNQTGSAPKFCGFGVSAAGGGAPRLRGMNARVMARAHNRTHDHGGFNRTGAGPMKGGAFLRNGGGPFGHRANNNTNAGPATAADRGERSIRFPPAPPDHPPPHAASLRDGSTAPSGGAEAADADAGLLGADAAGQQQLSRPPGANTMRFPRGGRGGGGRSPRGADGGGGGTSSVGGFGGRGGGGPGAGAGPGPGLGGGHGPAAPRSPAGPGGNGARGRPIGARWHRGGGGGGGPGGGDAGLAGNARGNRFRGGGSEFRPNGVRFGDAGGGGAGGGGAGAPSRRLGAFWGDDGGGGDGDVESESDPAPAVAGVPTHPHHKVSIHSSGNSSIFEALRAAGMTRDQLLERLQARASLPGGGPRPNLKNRHQQQQDTSGGNNATAGGGISDDAGTRMAKAMYREAIHSSSLRKDQLIACMSRGNNNNNAVGVGGAQDAGDSAECAKLQQLRHNVMNAKRTHGNNDVGGSDR